MDWKRVSVRRSIGNCARRVYRGVRSGLPLVLAVAAMFMLAGGAYATDAPTLPDLGVEDALATLIPLAIAAIGVFIVACLGAFCALLAFQVGMGWIKKLMAGKA